VCSELGKEFGENESFRVKCNLFLSTAYRRKLREEKGASLRRKEAEGKWAKEPMW